MAIYHLTTKVVARSKGHSAVAAAAYRARTKLTNERTGEVWDYSRKSADVLFAGIYAPKHAPEWMQDRAELWNGVEFSEKRKDAQVARDFIIGLPHELTDEQQRYALQDWIRENFTRRGFVADAAIHRPCEEGDQRNTHAHVLVTMRVVDGDGFAAKKERSADRLADLEEWRDSWEKIGNRHLTRHGHPATLDRRTLDAQGIDRQAQIHIGKDATEMERKGVPTERGDLMHQIQLENLAQDLEERFGQKVTVNELQRPAMVVPEAHTPATAELKQEGAPDDPKPERRRAPKGQGILATIWNAARNSSAAIAGFIFGPSRFLLSSFGEPRDAVGPDARASGFETSQPRRDSTSPAATGEDLSHAVEILDRLNASKSDPPPLTRQLTMIERLQQRKEQTGELADQNPRPARTRRLTHDLELDL